VATATAMGSRPNASGSWYDAVAETPVFIPVSTKATSTRFWLTPIPLLRALDLVPQRPSRSPDLRAIPRGPRKPLPAAFHFVPALRVPVDRLRSVDRHRGRDGRGPSNKGMRHMATIGTFASTGNGFSGSIKTLNLNVKAKLVRIENPSDKGPHFRIFSGNVELGAAWQKDLEGGPRLPLGQAGRPELPRSDLRHPDRGGRRGRPAADLVPPEPGLSIPQEDPAAQAGFLSAIEKPEPGIEPGPGFLLPSGWGRSAQIVRGCHGVPKAPRTSWYPQNADAFRLPHSPAPPVACRAP
jgi:hypothetical protein